MPKEKIWTRQEFLDLLDDDDVAELWKRWALPPADPKRRDATEFLEAVKARSTTTLVQEVLALRTATLQMLGDVLAFLIGQNTAARTTGSLLVLDGVAIGPQQVEAALKWSARAPGRHATETWEMLRNRFSDDIEPLFDKIRRYGDVDISRREEDVVDVAIRTMTGGSPHIGRTVTVEYDKDGLNLREEYLEKLAHLSECLQGLKQDVPSEDAGWLVSEIEELTRTEKAALNESHRAIQLADDVSNPLGYHDITDEDHEEWKRFVEDVLFLSDVEASTSVVDVLRLDLFRNRPQLYELWILVTIINFLRHRGHAVELLALATSAEGRLHWNLNYAKASQPVAKFVNHLDGSTSFLFYQLFRSGSSRDAMPDIALLPSALPNDRPIWVADPKHSERRGYSPRDYETVARRYHATFQPLHTWIIEYYPGADVLFDKGVELLTEVAPGRPGLAKFIARLREVHGTPAEVMAVIDVSGSFERKFDKVRADLATRLAAGEALSNEAIWFSDNAMLSSGIIQALQNGTLSRPPDIVSAGTRFEPVVELLKRLRAEGRAPVELRIYTDGGFADVTMESALAEIRTFVAAEVVDCG